MSSSTPLQVTVQESGMTFGPFDASCLFEVEKSTGYRRIQNDVRMVEFLWLKKMGKRRPQIWAVEAKKSTPRPGREFYGRDKNGRLEVFDELQKLGRSERLEALGRLDGFDRFIREIQEKLTNGLALIQAVASQCNSDFQGELPEEFQGLNLRDVDFRLILVVKGHEEDWLPPLTAALRTELRPLVKLWKLGANSVVVMNDDMARKQGLIQ